MDQLVSSAAMATIDSDAQLQYKIPGLSLMETAGFKIWASLAAEIHKEQHLVFLCGGGNNGGDALVVARLAFDQGYVNQVCILIGNHISPSCAVQREIIQAYGLPSIMLGDEISPQVTRALLDAGVVFDGIAGTGLKGPLQGISKTLVALANKSKALRVAIDIPSGLGDMISPDEIHFLADRTCTLGLSKAAFYHPLSRNDCGQIEILNPSFPARLLENVQAEGKLIDPKEVKMHALSSAAFKNSRGHVAIIGGSKSYTGAVRLSARAAFSSRAGLVTLFCDQEVFQLAATESPSVMVKTLSENDDFSPFNALLVGPGWGKGRESLLEKLFLTKKPMVLDADGIKAYANLLKDKKRPPHGPLLLTPHLGELRELAFSVFGDQALSLGKQDTPEAFFSMTRKLSRELDAILIMKSSLVHIAGAADQLIVMEGLNPSLGVAGSGDILSGIIAALLGNGIELAQTAVIGSAIHQNAGRLAHEELGYYDSETLLGFIGKAVGEMEQ
ncbi:yjeF-like protein, hydroxyethylthiazole kinase-related protein [Sphaerochaeta pleomorpha str. Grapes]|uniref:ADP-dependent (S)-NAD(P)H-hydrate dehydratase n=1 Tax=Sphaerochaeta pleomorpha (strain ATCC BAA-1885 / DSM 22778 / Grapes) TaxID=158190 RepID=G8QYF6_SPHPG|nr:bifunctional ADP-dependent NAD(P)H-hydrate dehydratase/NAD(P)H-hydrate epimerase [Sphaerochaeta pleomorpha]AEV30803.1 yjeF-like protein, hydroxyethylthiazole kinase-related protein [Sphaerochaeta pleomorpha str. Grapes]